ncbi:alpha/beta fold hydrolase [Streptomyces sp. NPDC049879]|uniref:alpha/beta fold hydrolase n=1 Tax=Streptomyces sp. NPDC049879 TaxID=3365598 RepID=UPI0037A68FF1
MTASDDRSHGNGSTGATVRSTLSPDDGDIHVCQDGQDGPHDAPALPLIHGPASSARAWNPMVPLLTGSHRVIRIGLPGHGRSAEPADRGYALPERLTALGKPLPVNFGADGRGRRSSSAADHRAVPGAAVEPLPGLGHSPVPEDPPRTAVPLSAFTATRAARVA